MTDTTTDKLDFATRSIIEAGQEASGQYLAAIENTERSLMPAPVEEIKRMASMLSKSGVLVPKAFRGNFDLCLGITYQAALWKMDAVAVCKKAYVVNDQVAYEAQLINALILPHLDDLPDYEYTGETKSSRQCTVTARYKGQTITVQSPQTSVIHPKNSPLWKTDEDQQLAYYTIRALARRHFPHIIMGVYAVDEIQRVQIKDVTPRRDPFADEMKAEEPSAPVDAEFEDAEGSNQWPLMETFDEAVQRMGAALKSCDLEEEIDALWSATEELRKHHDIDANKAFNNRRAEIKKETPAD